MTENTTTLADIIRHVEDIEGELKRMTARLSYLQIELEKKRSVLTSLMVPKEFQDRPHFAQLA